MITSTPPEPSYSLSEYQRGKVLATLKKLSEIHQFEKEKELGSASTNKKLVRLPRKKLESWMRNNDIDIDFLKKIISLLEKESVLVPVGQIVVEHDEKEEELFGPPVLVLFPVNFEERRKTYEQTLENLHQEKVRAEAPPTPQYKESIWSPVISALMNVFAFVVILPLFFLWKMLTRFVHDLAVFLYKFWIIPLAAVFITLWATGALSQWFGLTIPTFPSGQ